MIRLATSREAVDERLRRASDASATMGSATPRVEMGADAIDRRLRELSDLRRACVELGRLGAPLERP